MKHKAGTSGPVKGATHYATKTIQCLAEGGMVGGRASDYKKPARTMKTELMPDGSQQYVRGATRIDKDKTMERVSVNATRDMAGKPTDKFIDALDKSQMISRGRAMNRAKWGSEMDADAKQYVRDMRGGRR